MIQCNTDAVIDADKAELLRGFVTALFDDSTVDGCDDVDGGTVQELIEKYQLGEWRKAEQGSDEADEWGEDTPLLYLHDWVRNTGAVPPVDGGGR